MNPDVSLILPCRNEVEFIDSCISSILEQELPGRTFEVIVADGMSEDGTREKLARWQEVEPRVRVVDNCARITPAGLNMAISVARAPVLVRMDAHSTYPLDYLQRCLSALSTTGAQNVGGVVITLPRNRSLNAQLVQAISTHWFGVGNAKFRLGSSAGPADTVPFGCFRRSLFEKIGLFDERLVRNQDYEFNARIRTSGGTVWLDPSIQVRYYNQGTVGGLLRQAYVTSRWNIFTWHLAPYSFSARHLIPGLFLLFLLAGGVLALASAPGLIVYLSTLCLYALLALRAAYEKSRVQGNPRLALLLPPLFFIYHCSYGAGLLHGAVDLMLRRTPYSTSALPWSGAPSVRLRPKSLGRV